MLAHACGCRCVCVHMHVCTCVFVYYTCAYACRCAGAFAHVFTYMGIHVLCACVCVHVCICMCVCAFVHACLHMCVPSHSQTAHEGTRLGGPGSLHREQSRAGGQLARGGHGDEGAQAQGRWRGLSPVWVPPALTVGCLGGPAGPATEHTPDTDAREARP